MPPLIILGLAGAGLFFGAKFMAREMRRVAASMREVEADLARQRREPVLKDGGKLIADGSTGVYRVDGKPAGQ
jgi:hypothetical protein